MNQQTLVAFGNALRELMDLNGWTHRWDRPSEDVAPSYNLCAALHDDLNAETAASQLQHMIQELAMKHCLVIRKCDMTSGFCYLNALEPDPTHLLFVMSITITDEVRVTIADHSSPQRAK